MSDFRANEIFSDGPFVMLWIDSGWREKSVRFFLPDCRIGEVENGNWRLEKTGLGTWGSGLAETPRTEDEAKQSQWT